MKIIISVLFSVVLICTLSASAFAESSSIPDERLLPRLVDNADLLSDREEEDLLEKLDEISERQEFDVVVVTVNTLDGKTAEAYADDFYDYNGYGFGAGASGALLLVSMEDRDWHVTTTGYGITVITDAGLDYMSDSFVPYLSDGDYEEAFETFAELCDDFVTQSRDGDPYDVGNMPRGKFNFFKSLLFSLGLGVFIGWCVVSGMKKAMLSVNKKENASDYTKAGSMKVTVSNDTFLYKNVSKIRRQSSSSGGGSSTHRSSSGRSHGGRGGKF